MLVERNRGRSTFFKGQPSPPKRREQAWARNGGQKFTWRIRAYILSTQSCHATPKGLWMDKRKGQRSLLQVAEEETEDKPLFSITKLSLVEDPCSSNEVFGVCCWCLIIFWCTFPSSLIFSSWAPFALWIDFMECQTPDQTSWSIERKCTNKTPAHHHDKLPCSKVQSQSLTSGLVALHCGTRIEMVPRKD